ncbi:MAG: SH3 domain-containing protein [Sandaracinus sp.]|nr:SH3 domain-containing protein [Sandaracinus sp.]MCB9623217.1 SH3 domain-containing protein [Sandaracinus sp.]MCB9633701.1 SH3 domain-containing protein [Sandaracinus sp.]
MRWILVLTALSSSVPEVAHACDPVDAPVLLAVVGGDFVFVDGQKLTRVRPDGTVALTKELGFVSPNIALMPDGRHLLNPVPGGYTGMCLGEYVDLQVIDTTTDARPRSLGEFPRRRGVAALVGEITIDGPRMEIAIGALTVEDEYRWERVDVTSTHATSRGRFSPPTEEESAPTAPRARPPLARFGPLTVHASPPDSESHWVKVSSDSRDLVTVRLARPPLSARFSPDGTRLAVATYERVNEDYGTGFAARLDLVELSTGAVQTPVGETSGVSGVQGRVALQCTHRVNDAESALNVRRAPRSRAPVVGTVPHLTSVEVGERRGSWIELRAPVRGWAWAENVERHCTVR